MSKFRRYRKYSRRNRNRWSSNIQELGTTTIQSTQLGANSYHFTLAFNPTQINTAVSQLYTVKNFEVTFAIDLVSTSDVITDLEDVTAYIMFVPQGMYVTPDYNLQHPEYIMAYKFLGSPMNDITSSQAQPTKVRTRLSRNLNTGDSVILFIKYNDTRSSQTGTAPRFNFHGIARWNTKAN